MQQVVIIGHQCYVVKLEPQNRKHTQFASYDIETALTKQMINGREETVHKAVMACVTFRCSKCEDDDCPLSRPSVEPHGQSCSCFDCVMPDASMRVETKRPPTLCRRELTFVGSNCVTELYEALKQWSWKARGTRNVVMAHCVGRFDHQFLLRVMTNQDKKFSIIQKGNQIVCMTVRAYNMKIIDSYRFTPLKLSDFQKTLGLETAYQKSFWPHKLTPADLSDIDPFPGPEAFEPERMNEEQKREFETWCDRVRVEPVFRTASLMQQYCMQDVSVLAEGAMSFKKEWMAESDLDPFYSKVTLPGAVVELFRTKYQQESLPITPAHGYDSTKRTSLKATMWLDEMEEERGQFIKREVYVGRDFVFDGAIVE